MDAVKLLKEFQRMCKNSDCSTCGLAHINDDPFPCLWEFNYEKYAEQIISVVEKWSIEHPVKTRLTDFLEKHPDAPKTNNGYPPILPITLGYCKNYKRCTECPCGSKNNLHDCWEMSLDEVKEN